MLPTSLQRFKVQVLHAGKIFCSKDCEERFSILIIQLSYYEFYVAKWGGNNSVKFSREIGIKFWEKDEESEKCRKKLSIGSCET